MLVDHEAELLAVGLHAAEGVEDLDRLGQEERRAGVGRHRVVRSADQVAEVDGADHLVEVLAGGGDRRSGMAGLGQEHGRGLAVHGPVDGHHIGPRAQHLTQGPLRGLEGAFDDLPLVGGERGVLGDDPPHLLGAHLLGQGVGVPTDQPHDEVGGVGEEPDHGPGDRGHDRQGPGGEQAPALGVLHGQSLRDQLAEDEGHIGQDQGDHHDRHGAGRVAEEAQRLLQRHGQGHRRGGRGQEAREGDADLDRRQELVGASGQVGQRPAPSAARLLEAADLALPERHQSQLGPGECGVDRHQHRDEHELGAGPVHGGEATGPSIPPRGSGGRTPCARRHRPRRASGRCARAGSDG